MKDIWQLKKMKDIRQLTLTTGYALGLDPEPDFFFSIKDIIGTTGKL